MDLSFTDLKKREVININDGSSLGQINDIVLSFPAGVMTGIVVPGKKTCFLFKWIKSSKDIFISRKNIQKIGNDVILVNINLGIVPNNVQQKPNCCNTTNNYINNTTINVDDNLDIDNH